MNEKMDEKMDEELIKHRLIEMGISPTVEHIDWFREVVLEEKPEEEIYKLSTEANEKIMWLMQLQAEGRITDMTFHKLTGQIVAEDLNLFKIEKFQRRSESNEENDM